MYCKSAKVWRDKSNLILEAIDHCRYQCGSALLLSDGELEFQKALVEGGLPLVWTRARLQCHHALEWSLYKAINEGRAPSLRLDVGCFPCVHCGVQVGAENGLEEWKKEAAKSPNLDVAPLCSNETCRSYGWITKAKRKPNQVKVAQQKHAAKKRRVEEHRRSAGAGGSSAASAGSGVGGREAARPHANAGNGDAGRGNGIIRPNAVAHATMGGRRPRSTQ